MSTENLLRPDRINVSAFHVVRKGLVVAFVVAAAFLPQMTQNQYYLGVAFQAEMLMCLALGLNIVVGYAGMLDLGFAAFFAIGAYTTGILSTKEHWSILASIAPGVVVAVISALIIGFPTLRLRSDYLAVVTLGFGEIIQAIAINLNQTGGPTGIYAIPALTIGSVVVASNTGYYYVFFVLVVVFALFSSRLRSSRFGRAWLCIREDEDAAKAMGINTNHYKLYAYVFGALLGSITGSLYAPALTAISPASFGFSESLLIVMAVAIGGLGSIWGVIFGAAVVEIFPEVFRSFAQARLLVFGVALVILMVLRPRGLFPERAFRGLGARIQSRFGPTHVTSPLQVAGDAGKSPLDES
ncbi:MAG: branched-chain amino acid ABC transporter permease [Acidobacteria bacterium]|nr:branched-chain amino acid ABC transporter permease [Acidobacteriota bacterium]